MRRSLKFAGFFPGIALLAHAVAGAVAAAATLEVTVQDREGRPVPDVVVTATATGVRSSLRAEPPLGVVDQINQRFVPEVLVIQAGTSVVFPNSDLVAHQVYSFSPAKRFALGLYRGHPYPPVLFDRPGLVILGCNIHDQMVGYILVTDTPHFGRTDARGSVHLKDLPDGALRVTAWGARIAADEPGLERTVNVGETGAATVAFRLTRALGPAGQQRKEPRERDY